MLRKFPAGKMKSKLKGVDECIIQCKQKSLNMTLPNIIKNMR